MPEIDCSRYVRRGEPAKLQRKWYDDLPKKKKQLDFDKNRYAFDFSGIAYRRFLLHAVRT